MCFGVSGRVRRHESANLPLPLFRTQRFFLVRVIGLSADTAVITIDSWSSSLSNTAFYSKETAVPYKNRGDAFAPRGGRNTGRTTQVSLRLPTAVPPTKCRLLLIVARGEIVVLLLLVVFLLFFRVASPNISQFVCTFVSNPSSQAGNSDR